MSQQQPPNAYDWAYQAGKEDAEENTTYNGDYYTHEGQGVAYARGWLDGHPQHSIQMVRLLASPIER